LGIAKGDSWYLIFEGGLDVTGRAELEDDKLLMLNAVIKT
jgi:hypothetical protein